MDRNEIIALGIVVVAALLAVRYFLRQKGGSCCPKDCFKPKDPSAKK
jgi:hypothetical protein